MKSQSTLSTPRKSAKTPVRKALRGLFAGTSVAVENGWQPVEALSVGSRVWTFDMGLQPVTRILPVEITMEGVGAKLSKYFMTVPAGTLGNEKDLLFLPSEGLLLECENAKDPFGDPFAVVPVSALDGICGMKRGVPPQPRKLFRLCFEQPQAVYIDSGLLVHCPTFDARFENERPRYDVKTAPEARELLTDLDLAELALREANEDFRVTFEAAAVSREAPGAQKEARDADPETGFALSLRYARAFFNAAREFWRLVAPVLKQLGLIAFRTARKSFGSSRLIRAASRGR
ncbi:MAG: Hint domain-containing protein [Pseudomonadota bacterium]